jgi:hypothetical protein
MTNSTTRRHNHVRGRFRLDFHFFVDFMREGGRAGCGIYKNHKAQAKKHKFNGGSSSGDRWQAGWLAKQTIWEMGFIASLSSSWHGEAGWVQHFIVGQREEAIACECFSGSANENGLKGREG